MGILFKVGRSRSRVYRRLRGVKETALVAFHEPAQTREDKGFEATCIALLAVPAHGINRRNPFFRPGIRLCGSSHSAPETRK
jgi:hypothetical protein